MKTTLQISALACAMLMTNSALKAQMVGVDAFMKGTGVEIGIDGTGGYEGAPSDSVPAGMHYRSNNPYFGFVANPQNDAWTNFDGDFFTPGSPENGWGFEIGTSSLFAGSNNCTMAGMDDIPGSITSWSHIAPEYLVDWEGNYTTGTNLNFKINYNLQETDLFYTTTVTITNNTSDTIPELYYYRNLDPDNNIMLTGDYSTQNTILEQPFGGGAYASVSASQTTPWNSYFSFVTDLDAGWRAGYGGFSNRDASDMWNGFTFTQTVGYSNFADEAIFIAYKIQNLIPGGSQTFKFCSTFDPTATECALAQLGVSITPVSPVNTGTPAFALSATPAGGTFSGTGVVGNTFDPSVSGAGDFTVLYTYTDTNACTSVVNTTVHVQLPAGIENNLSSALTVYPNPFADFTTIKVGNDVKLVNAELHVYDMVGRDVKAITNINTNEIKIDRKGMGAGAYYYKLINGNKDVATGRLIVK